MRTVSFRDSIVWPIVSRLGYDPTKDLSGDFQKDFAAALARYINAWVRKCWDAADWPELSKIEVRTPVQHLIPYDEVVAPPADWVGTDTFNLDAVVRDPNDNTQVYISIQNSNTNHALSDTSWWTLLDAWDKTLVYSPNDKVVDSTSGIVYVAQQTILPNSVLSDSLSGNPAAWQPIYSEKQAPATVTPIGKVLKVYMNDPRLADGPFDIPFSLEDTNIHIGYVHGTTVWLKFMTRASIYTLESWSATVSFARGELVYDPTTGECYQSKQNNNLNHPVTNASWWTIVPFPMVIADPVWRGAYSDALRDEGQHAKAQAEEQAALAELQASIQRNLSTRYDTVTNQETGVPRSVSMVHSGTA